MKLAFLLTFVLLLGKPVTTTSSITLLTPNPHLGGYVQFSYEVPHGAAPKARIQILCYQQDVPFAYTDSNGVSLVQLDPLVYGVTAPAGDLFYLGGAGSVWLWHGGDADCVASVYTFEKVKGQSVAIIYASVSFHAVG
jgi:hypothetical protein